MVDLLLEWYRSLSSSLAGVEVLLVKPALEKGIKDLLYMSGDQACSRFYTGHVHKQQANTTSCPERRRRNKHLQLVSKSAKSSNDTQSHAYQFLSLFIHSINGSSSTHTFNIVHNTTSRASQPATTTSHPADPTLAHGSDA